MRQWNKELNEFAKMRELYGKDAPYKMLGSFRRAYRSEEGSLPYAKTHYYRRDNRQYKEYVAVLSKENMPSTLAEFQQMKYNESRRFDLLRQYKEIVADGGVTNVGFAEYEKVLREAQRKIIGVQTSAGVTVKGISKHLVDRIIGSEKQKRVGVPVTAVVDTLRNGFCDGVIKTNAKGQRSVGFVKDEVYVSFNIDEDKVVQCRPRGKKEIKKYGR